MDESSGLKRRSWVGADDNLASVLSFSGTSSIRPLPARAMTAYQRMAFGLADKRIPHPLIRSLSADRPIR